MKRDFSTHPTGRLGRRLAAWGALVALGASLAGCVVYPAGYYGHPHYYYGGGYYYRPY